MSGRRAAALAGALAAALSLGPAGCGRDEPGTSAGADASEAHTIDVGAIRAAAIDGLEAAAADPVTVRALGLAAALVGSDRADGPGPALVTATERLLARVGQDDAVERAADEFFAAVQGSPAVRANLVEYAQQNPELELSELTAGFVAHVDARLTRPAVAEAIAASVRAELLAVDGELAAAALVEAELAELLAELLLVRLAEPKVEAALTARLGRDPATLEARLVERLAEPRRASFAIEALGEVVASEAGTAALAAIVDHEQTAALVGEALTRLLADAGVQAQGEAVFGLALAEPLDVRAFERALAQLLDEPAVAREGRVLLTGLARAEHVREPLAALVARVAVREQLGDELVAALD